MSPVTLTGWLPLPLVPPVHERPPSPFPVGSIPDDEDVTRTTITTIATRAATPPASSPIRFGEHLLVEFADIVSAAGTELDWDAGGETPATWLSSGFDASLSFIGVLHWAQNLDLPLIRLPHSVQYKSDPPFSLYGSHDSSSWLAKQL